MSLHRIHRRPYCCSGMVLVGKNNSCSNKTISNPNRRVGQHVQVPPVNVSLLFWLLVVCCCIFFSNQSSSTTTITAEAIWNRIKIRKNQNNNNNNINGNRKVSSSGSSSTGNSCSTAATTERDARKITLTTTTTTLTTFSQQFEQYHKVVVVQKKNDDDEQEQQQQHCDVFLYKEVVMRQEELNQKKKDHHDSFLNVHTETIMITPPPPPTTTSSNNDSNDSTNDNEKDIDSSNQENIESVPLSSSSPLVVEDDMTKTTTTETEPEAATTETETAKKDDHEINDDDNDGDDDDDDEDDVDEDYISDLIFGSSSVIITNDDIENDIMMNELSTSSHSSSSSSSSNGDGDDGAATHTTTTTAPISLSSSGSPLIQQQEDEHDGDSSRQQQQLQNNNNNNNTTTTTNKRRIRKRERFLNRLTVLTSLVMKRYESDENDASLSLLKVIPSEQLKQLRIKFGMMLNPTTTTTTKLDPPRSPPQTTTDDNGKTLTDNHDNNNSTSSDTDADDDLLLLNELDAITPQSDLSLPGRYVHIVTTAALPWFTGTAVNPLLRAAYLHRKLKEINSNNNMMANKNDTTTTTTTIHDDFTNSTPTSNVDDNHHHHHHNSSSSSYVTLVIPWLELPEDQRELYQGRIFPTMLEQEIYIRNWLRTEAQLQDAATELHILFYPARYHSGLHSIFAMGDIMDVIPMNHQRDVCILEEPEHCNWFRAPGDGWTQRFNYVVGIVHTNYKEYASSHYSGLWTAPAIQLISAAMVRAYCHKVIKLSSVLQSYAPEKEATSNVHGVRSEFIETGIQRKLIATTTTTTIIQQEEEQQSQEQEEFGTTTNTSTTTIATPILSDPNATSTTQVYFIGKLLWAKGLDLLLELEDYYQKVTGDYFAIDIYGNGPDEKAITRAFHGVRSSSTSVTSSTSSSSTSSTIKKTEEMTENESMQETTTTTTAVINDNTDGDEKLLFASASSSFNIHIMGTTVSVDSNNDEGGGVVGGGLGESFQSSLDSLPSLESLQVKAKEQIAKIKETINSVEIPQSFSEFRRQPIPATFPGRVDHAILKEYKIFMNPSVSEVLCTTTAEALAMGKFVIIPDHPSNKFFLQFPNCLAYRNKYEFVANVKWALAYEPEPLTSELMKQFTWEAATDRLLTASAVTYREALEREKLGRQKLDDRIAWFHNEIGKGSTGDMLRKLFGAGPVSHQVKYQQEQQQQQQKQTTSLTDTGTDTDNNYIGPDVGEEEDIIESIKQFLSRKKKQMMKKKKKQQQQQQRSKKKNTSGDNVVPDNTNENHLHSKLGRSSFVHALRAALLDISSMME